MKLAVETQNQSLPVHRPVIPMKLLLLALLLSANAAMGQPFSLEKDEAGEIVQAFVTNDNVTAKQLTEIAGIKTLQHLTLGFAPEGVRLEKGAIAALANCRALKSLQLAKFDLADEDLEFLSKLESLESLRIEGSDLVYDPNNRNHGLTDNSFGSLAALQNLDRLIIRGYGDFSDDFAKKISEFSKLTALELSSRHFTDEALTAIAANPRLKELSIRSPHFTDNGVQALARMSELEELEIGSPSLTQQSLHSLAPLTGLKVLDLPIKEIDRDALAVVAGMKSMMRLILRRAEIGDQHFEVLKGHPSLESLFFGSSTLTEKSSEVLESLTKLRYADFGRKSWIHHINKDS